MPLSELTNAVIGVEATSYLTLMISEPPAQEPLLAALGGDPIGLKSHVGAELDKWKEYGMRPFFVFDGQSRIGQDEIALRKAKAALVKTELAWEMYADNRPGEAVKAFGEAGAIRVQDLYRILQEVLVERGLPFQIAPFSAGAQVSSLSYYPVISSDVLACVPCISRTTLHRWNYGLQRTPPVRHLTGCQNNISTNNQ
jgi:hypothetical protein